MSRVLLLISVNLGGVLFFIFHFFSFLHPCLVHANPRLDLVSKPQGKSPLQRRGGHSQEAPAGGCRCARRCGSSGTAPGDTHSPVIRVPATADPPHAHTGADAGVGANAGTNAGADGDANDDAWAGALHCRACGRTSTTPAAAAAPATRAALDGPGSGLWRPKWLDLSQSPALLRTASHDCAGFSTATPDSTPAHDTHSHEP